MFKNISKVFAAGLQPLPNHQVKTMNSTWIYTLIGFLQLPWRIHKSCCWHVSYMCCWNQWTPTNIYIYIICICISLEIEYFQNILQIFSWRLLAHEPLLEDRSDLLLYDLCCCSWQVLPCYTCQNLALWFHHGWTHPQQKKENTHTQQKKENTSSPRLVVECGRKTRKTKITWNNSKNYIYIYTSVKEMSGFSIDFCVQIVGTAFAL